MKLNIIDNYMFNLFIDMMFIFIGRYSIVNGLGGIFVLLGEIFVCACTVFFCYCIFMYADYYRTNLTSPILPLLLIFVISFTIGIIFMGVYGMTIDAILICFIFEEKECK